MDTTLKERLARKQAIIAHDARKTTDGMLTVTLDDVARLVARVNELETALDCLIEYNDELGELLADFMEVG
jgi:hypothetical protein